MTESVAYPLGYSESEARRLADQGALFEDLTEEVLRRAGLCSGMRVLDVGCGVGDVSLHAVRLVGADGAVFGVDRSRTSIDTARRRAGVLGAGNLNFLEADIASFESDPLYDAVVGRLVLLYVPDPAKILRRVSRFLRPGGVVAFQEIDIPQIAQTPESKLFRQVSLVEGR